MSGITKIWSLILAIVIVLLLCYKYAISNTLDLRKEFQNLTVEKELLKDSPKQLAVLTRKHRQYDSILNNLNLGNTSVENNLLRIINLEAEKNKFKVLDFNEAHVSKDNNNSLNTFEFTLEGDYLSLLKAIYVIEQKNSFGEIIHLNFQKKKNYRKNNEYLISRVLIQQVH